MPAFAALLVINSLLFNSIVLLFMLGLYKKTLSCGFWCFWAISRHPEILLFSLNLSTPWQWTCSFQRVFVHFANSGMLLFCFKQTQNLADCSHPLWLFSHVSCHTMFQIFPQYPNFLTSCRAPAPPVFSPSCMHWYTCTWDGRPRDM